MQRPKDSFLRIFGITSVKDKEWKSFLIFAFAIFLLIFVILYDFIEIKGTHTNLVLFMIGIVILLLGIVMRVTTIIQLGKYFSLHVELAPDHKIVKKGFYRYLRHPMYTATLIMGLGGIILFASGWGLLCYILIFIPTIIYRIKVEERFLLSRFGRHYKQYKRETYRVIPLIW